MAGKGTADGGRSGTVRNPEYYCIRPGCNQYRVRGTTICTAHGASRKAAKRRAATAMVAKAAGTEAAAIEPQDFPKVVGELVGWHLAMVRDLQQELSDLQIIGSPIEMARDYSDILDRLDKSSAGVAKLMGAVAALGIADAFQQQAHAMTASQREDRVNRLLAVTMEAEPAGPMWQCPTCGRACCSQVVEAELVDDVL